MDITHLIGDYATKWLRYSALILALIWAGWWTFFGLASGIGEGSKPVGVLLHTAAPGLIFLASAVIAWRWERIGAIVLLVEGALILIGYPLLFRRFPLSTILFVLLTMALPPLVAGCLLLADWQKSKPLLPTGP